MIIVIIIVGILASLSLTRFVKLIEGARATEAIDTCRVFRMAMDRCYLMHNGSYATCYLKSTANPTANTLDMEDPTLSPNAHFVYRIEPDLTGRAYFIEAYRNSLELGGSAHWGDYIYMGYGCKPTMVSGGVTYTWLFDDKVYWAAHPAYKNFIP